MRIRSASIGIDTYFLSPLPAAHDYVRQFYDGKDLLLLADRVTPNSSKTGIDFQLRRGAGSMTGVVYEADGVTPIGQPLVELYVLDGGEWVLAYRARSQPDGSYLALSLRPGDYRR